MLAAAKAASGMSAVPQAGSWECDLLNAPQNKISVLGLRGMNFSGGVRDFGFVNALDP